MCRGVIADNQVNTLEAQALQRWIEANEEHSDKWPFDVILDRLEVALDDGHLDETEAQDLFELLIDITGGETPIEARVASYATSLPLTRPYPTVEFPERSFCLTGKFLFGTRNRCESAIRERGGIPIQNVNGETDYLVIGAMGSSQWLHSTHGLKIEAARFHDTVIIHEGHWCDELEKCPLA